MGATKDELMRAEVARLKGLDAALRRDWKRIPFLFLLIVLVVPAQWLYGPLVALFTVLCVPALVLTAAYLIGVRRRENRDLLVELEAQLKTRP